MNLKNNYLKQNGDDAWYYITSFKISLNFDQSVIRTLLYIILANAERIVLFTETIPFSLNKDESL